MNFWWVNHGGSFDLENPNGYLWAPSEGKVFWENLKRVKKGDFVFSYARKHIRAIGEFLDDPIVLTKHPYTNETGNGRYLKVSWVNLNSPFKTINIWETTKNLFEKCINPPLTKNGTGCQGYLYKITADIFETYCEYIQKYSKTDVSKFMDTKLNDANDLIDIEPIEKDQIEDKDDIDIEGINFNYERNLQKAFVQQIDKLFPEYTAFSGKDGTEYIIDGKRIDVLLEKQSCNELLAIELKAGVAKRDALAQISEYMGKLMKKFPDKKINGIIIAADIDEGLKDACLPYPNIKTLKYKIELTIFE
jgi:hypothetical protein